MERSATTGFFAVKTLIFTKGMGEMTNDNNNKDMVVEIDHSDAKQKPFELPDHPAKYLEAIDKHLEEHFGDKYNNVFDEIKSHLVHIDVHIIEPTHDRPFYLLVTSGMSDRPMTVPEWCKEYQLAELCIMLPPDWDLNYETFKNDQRKFWPVSLITKLARMPHEYDTYLVAPHTVSNNPSDPPLAEDVGFSAVMLIPPYDLPTTFAQLHLDDGNTIHFWLILPLYSEEMAFKNENGVDAFLDLFYEKNDTSVVDVNRLPCV